VEDIPLSHLYTSLVVLLFLSAFFSASETSMMALNRYRLRHLAREGHRTAQLVDSLIRRPDRLLGLILVGNNLVNFGAAAVTSVIALRLMGEFGLALAPFVITPIVLILCEVAPKTLAALHPERIAYPAAYLLVVIGRVLNPFVWIINRISNALLALGGFRPEQTGDTQISREELRSVVIEAGGMIPRRHQRMLLSILDLEQINVDDIMVNRAEITGIDLDKSPEEIVETLFNSQHTRLPVYRGNIDNIVGILHVRRVPRLLKDRGQFDVQLLEKSLQEPYFVPLGIQLHNQLVNFQRTRQRAGLVVDEYGVIQGLVTIEDILEEIVGKFTTDLQVHHQYIHPQPDGAYLIDGGATIREINRQLHWDLPAEGPRTLNGMILEHLQTMPEAGTTLRFGSYAIEITAVKDNAVRTVRVKRLAGEAETAG
jgi:Mg2+/Co2+ transporter CorB